MAEHELAEMIRSFDPDAAAPEAAGARRARGCRREAQSKKGVTSATITAFSAPARCISARSSCAISRPSASRSASVP